MERYLGIDYGTKRIGLALGDSLTKLATPFKVVSTLADIVAVIKEEDIEHLVVGLPLTMRKEKGEMHEKVQEFISDLSDLTGLPIEQVDERLSSKAGDALVGGKKDKAPRDAIAAMLILQSFFDKHA
ncbi:Holliday junction resolvase RuvX [Candidatus Falkowbacteria bacterium]|nr:Holliday junction resolvase RuvX [Candidatus Falkowbacteria bacterium]